MKIYIEVLIIIILLFIFLFWKLWYMFSTKRLIKKYKPENDKSRKGGIFKDGKLTTTEQRTDAEPIGLIGHEQSEGRRILQEAVVSDVGEDSNSDRKDVGRSLVGFLRRRKK